MDRCVSRPSALLCSVAWCLQFFFVSPSFDSLSFSFRELLLFFAEIFLFYIFLLFLILFLSKYFLFRYLITFHVFLVMSREEREKKHTSKAKNSRFKRQIFLKVIYALERIFRE